MYTYIIIIYIYIYICMYVYVCMYVCMYIIFVGFGTSSQIKTLL